MADVCEEASQEVSILNVSGDGNTFCGARQGMFQVDGLSTGPDLDGLRSSSLPIVGYSSFHCGTIPINAVV